MGVKVKAQAGYVAAVDRVGTARAGRGLLDHSESAQRAVEAKAACHKIVQQDADVLQRVRAEVQMLDEASALLRDSRSGNLPEGIDGVQDFEGLAEAYENRSRIYRRMLEELEALALPAPPAMTAAECDAAIFL